MNLKQLRDIGLTEGEISVYEALLDLGECTKTSLAEKSGVAPSNIYDITNRLLEKGIISKVEKNGIAHFSPANPNRLLDFLETKKEAIEEEKSQLSDILPLLLTKFNKTKEKVNVEVFQGWSGLKTVFEDLLEECKKGDTNYVFGASKGSDNEQAANFFIKYSKARADKGIITNIIFNEDMQNNKERISFFLKSKKYEVRFLQQTTPAEIMVYNDKTCIILLSQEPLTIRITGQEAASSFKQYFDVMWKLAKKK